MDININFNQLSKNEKLRIYIENLTPILNRKALFSDGTKEYRNPAEPMPYDRVTIRFRTGKANVDEVYLITTKERVLMKKVESNQIFDYYETKISVENTTIKYYFEIISGGMKCYYDKQGPTNQIDDYYQFMIWPGFRTPDWAKGAVFYQIYVDRFFNGDSSNDIEDREYIYIGEPVKRVTDWNKYPDAMGVREFYGGDLKGVIKKLDYLKELGIDAIYFNPIFVSPSNHKYDIQDYDYVDPHFGAIIKEEGEVLKEGDNNNTHATKYITRVTNKENLEASNQVLIELIRQAHQRGIKVILDGVFNHCGSFNKWLDRERIYEQQDSYKKGAYVEENSPYRTFFKFREENWPYNDKYDGWWGHDTLPKLNYEESPILYEYIMKIARKWVSAPFYADGWRLDVAADLGHSNEYNHLFWKDFRKNVKAANPNAIILAEHYGDPSSWLQGDEWDTVMNYDAFMEPVTWFLTGMEKHSDEFHGDMMGNSSAFFGAMNHHMARFNTQSLQVAMNELSNHDHSRFLTRTNHMVGRTVSLGPKAAEQHINKGLMHIAVMIQMTWPGAPTIYYGDEAGVVGWTDPDSRRTYPWGNEDKGLIQLHKELIRIHKDYDALKTGSLLFLGESNNYISYGRFDKKDMIIVAANINEYEIEVEIPVWRIGVTDDIKLSRLILVNKEGYELDAKIYYANKGVLKLIIPSVSGVVIKNMMNY